MGKKYDLEREGATGLFRVVALRDIPRYGVTKGARGGLVQRPTNLSQHGDAWIAEGARVIGRASVSRHALVTGRAEVSGQARVSGFARVSDDARVFGHARIFDDARVFGGAQVFGRTYVRGRRQGFRGCPSVR